MHRKSQLGKAIFHTLSKLIMVALAMGALPAWAQQVFPNAREAAKSPAVASRLAHPALPQATQPAMPQTTRPQTRKHSKESCAPQDSGVMYENGPVNGTTDAWAFSSGFQNTQSFRGGGPVTGFSMWVWIAPGDSLTGLQLSISTSPFGSDLFNTTLGAPVTSNCFTNTQYGYNVCYETWTFSGPTVNGDYWVTLWNGTTAFGTQPFWDENSGIGCTSPGCPSTAMLNEGIGTIPSEAFTLGGAPCTFDCPPPPPPPCFHSDGTMQIIHDFTPQEVGNGPNGVTADSSGHLYGTTSGGTYGAGMVYQLARRGEDWLFTPIYNFRGGSDGSMPSSVILGSDGALYGTAGDLLFKLISSPVPCPTVICGWREQVLYRFTGGAPANLSFDQAGNLYGTLGQSVLKLTPSSGGWTETIIYTFTGYVDGYPISLLASRDGNLYGTTAGGGDYGSGTVFQLMPSADGWTKSILYSAQNSPEDGESPENLHQDSSGNLYGNTSFYVDCAHMYDMVFRLSPSSQGWVFRMIDDLDYGQVSTVVNNLATDMAGNYYYTYTHWQPWPGWAETYAWTAVGGNVDWWTSDYFDPGGPLAVDASHLYGTTYSCGSHGWGTLWRLPH